MGVEIRTRMFKERGEEGASAKRDLGSVHVLLHGEDTGHLTNRGSGRFVVW